MQFFITNTNEINMIKKAWVWRKAKNINGTKEMCKGLLEMMIDFICAVAPWIKRFFSSIHSDKKNFKCCRQHLIFWYFYESIYRNVYYAYIFIISASTINGMAVCFCTVLCAGQFSNMWYFSHAKVKKEHWRHLKSHLLTGGSSVFCTSFLPEMRFYRHTQHNISLLAELVLGSLTPFLSVIFFSGS